MMLTQEQAILKGEQQLQSMIEALHHAATENHTIDEVERDIWRRVLGLGLTMLQVFLSMEGTGDVGESLDHEGHVLKRLPKLHDRRYVSVFGPLTISRTVYGSRETQKHELIPLDARLSLPESDFSYLLQEWDQSFCVKDSYEDSRQSVDRILGIGQSVRSLEHMNRSMARDVPYFHDCQAPPDPAKEGSILVLTADGKGVPMRREPDQKVSKSRRKKGDKANKKRSACVGGVYTIEEFLRKPTDVVDEVLRKLVQQKRPEPQQKLLRAELTRTIGGNEVKGKEIIFSWFYDQVRARNSDGEKTVVCVMDGERALWKMQRRYIPQAICILDIFHVLERLWVATHCFYPEGSDEAQEFVSEKLERILEGRVGRVIGGLKQMATKRKLKGAKKKRLFLALGYLKNNRKYMKYDEYLENGYPIGSGVVEGACRHLVKDRMELTGMHWRTEGAQSMLSLRAVFLNDDWDAFQGYHAEDEAQRLYPYREEIISQWNIAA